MPVTSARYYLEFSDYQITQSNWPTLEPSLQRAFSCRLAARYRSAIHCRSSRTVQALMGLIWLKKSKPELFLSFYNGLKIDILKLLSEPRFETWSHWWNGGFFWESSFVVTSHATFLRPFRASKGFILALTSHSSSFHTCMMFGSPKKKAITHKMSTNNSWYTNFRLIQFGNPSWMDVTTTSTIANCLDTYK